MSRTEPSITEPNKQMSYFFHLITANAAIEMLKTHKLFNQLSFHDPDATSLLKFTKAIEVTE